MDKCKLIETFFNKSYEANINKEMLNYNYVFPHERVMEYVRALIQVPIQEYIDSVRSKIYLTITCKDVPQFSSLADATTRYCQVLADNNDTGFKFDDVGRLLLNDGISRAIGAYRKYGENHSKTACQLGLSQNLYNNFYLSSLGKIYNFLSESDKNALITRTALRNTLYAKIFSLVESQNVNIAHLCQSLSESTLKRRRSNVMKICNIIIQQCLLEGFQLEHNIYFVVD